jgi:UDP-N-acetylglucosamine 2-epimerase (non-hydrolysing)
VRKLKVVTIVGTRPEIIRLSRLIPKLDQFTDHILVHTGQNYDPKLNDVFFEDLQLRQPDYFLNVEASSMGTVMGETLRKAEQVFLEVKPDAVMILGDTNSAIAAVVAERMQIPVYHMEAGNRSFDNNVPEELNRRMVDHVSTFNLPYNDYSMRNLLTEGIHPRFIHKTGSPMLEIFNHYKSRIESSSVLRDLNLTPKGYFLVSIHRQENVDFPDRLEQVLKSLAAIRDEWNLPIMVSTHPRTRKKLEELSNADIEGITFHEPFGYLDYNQLQLQAKCVISDSGTISEESSIMKFPAVTLRDSMERPEGLEAGTLSIASLKSSQLLNQIKLAQESRRSDRLPEGYEQSEFSGNVLNFLLSTCELAATWRGLHSKTENSKI